MEDYKEKYEMALEGVQEILSSGQDSIKMSQLALRLHGIFPELKESEDEKMVKAIIKALQSHSNSYNKLSSNGIQMEDAIAWLNRQVPTKISEEDERIRKEIIAFIKKRDRSGCDYDYDQWIAWLEKQGDNNNQNWKPSKGQINALEHFVRGIGESGYASPYDDNAKLLKSLINDLYKLEKRGEQKPFDYESVNIQQTDFAPKQEPKFKIGDYIVNDYCAGKVVALTDDAYLLDTGQGIPFSCEHNVHLWTIADAKDGDVLAGKIDGDDYILIFRQIKDGWIETYGHYYYTVNRFCVPSQLFCRSYQGTFTPATKEQRDILIKAMADAGHAFDFEKKELKKIEQKPVEDKDVERASADYRNFRMSCGINDPVMLDEIEEAYYEGAISRKSAEWSEEDDYNLQCMIAKVTSDIQKGNVGRNNELIDWLKSLKDRLSWKPSKKQMETLEYYMHTLLATKHKEVLFGLYNDLKKL